MSTKWKVLLLIRILKMLYGMDIPCHKKLNFYCFGSTSLYFYTLKSNSLVVDNWNFLFIFSIKKKLEYEINRLDILSHPYWRRGLILIQLIPYRRSKWYTTSFFFLQFYYNNNTNVYTSILTDNKHFFFLLNLQFPGLYQIRDGHPPQ